MKKHLTSLFELIQKYTPNPVKGAEVGVWKGETSAALLQSLPDCTLHLVDTWAAWEVGSTYHDAHKIMGDLTAEQWEEIYRTAVRNVKQIMFSRYQIHRKTSELASQEIKDEELDFVFLDANHTYEEILKDIELWTPKVRRRGLVMGHDYQGRNDKIGIWGVSRAVHATFGEENVISKPGRIWAIVKD